MKTPYTRSHVDCSYSCTRVQLFIMLLSRIMASWRQVNNTVHTKSLMVELLLHVLWIQLYC